MPENELKSIDLMGTMREIFYSWLLVPARIKAVKLPKFQNEKVVSIVLGSPLEHMESLCKMLKGILSKKTN
jgi:hypothetical protein